MAEQLQSAPLYSREKTASLDRRAGPGKRSAGTALRARKAVFWVPAVKGSCLKPVLPLGNFCILYFF